MKKLRRFVPWLLTLAFLSGCKCPADGGDRDPSERKAVVLSDLNQIRYTETYENGDKYQIFAYITNNRTSLHFTERDGSKRQYRIDGTELFRTLETIINTHGMPDWKYLETEDVEPESDPKIKVDYREQSRDLDFGSRRMPVGGMDALAEIKAACLAAENEEDEIKAFTVKIGGKTYSTVRGTGNSVGAGAVIDFGDDLWWVVEKFVGRYELTEKSRKLMEEENMMGAAYPSAVMEIGKDGSVRFQVGDDKEITGFADEERLYQCYATACGGSVEFDRYQGDEKSKFLEVMMRPLPYPETFPGYEVILERVK